MVSEQILELVLVLVYSQRTDKADFYGTCYVWGGLCVYIRASFMLSEVLQMYRKKCLQKYNKIAGPEKKNSKLPGHILLGMHSIQNLSKLLNFLSSEWLSLHTQALFFSGVCMHMCTTSTEKLSNVIHTSELKLFQSCNLPCHVISWISCHVIQSYNILNICQIH